MSNLVPEKRVNKNGVLVTKHVRADGSTVPSKNLPSPSLGKVKMSQQEAVSAVLKAYEENYQGEHLTQEAAGWQEILEEGLGSYSPEVLSAYHEMIIAHPRTGYESLLARALDEGQNSDDAGYLLLAAKRDKLQSFEWAEDGGSAYTFRRISSLSHGLQSLDGYFSFEVPQCIYKSGDARTMEALSAISQVTNSVRALDGNWGLVYTYDSNGDELGVSLESNDLIELIAEYPERADQISTLIYERETTDADLIRTVIESGHTALGDGAL